MAAKDLYHEHVKHALISDGWTITHDPLRLEWGENIPWWTWARKRVLAAEKGLLKIAVEVKSFLGKSSIDDLEKALGQYVLYHDILAENEPDRLLYLAVRESVFESAADAAYWELLLRRERLRIILFDPDTKEIRKWIPQIN